MDRRAVALIAALVLVLAPGCTGADDGADTAAPAALARSLTVASAPTLPSTVTPPRAIGTASVTIPVDEADPGTGESAPIADEARPLSELQAGDCVDLPVFADPAAVEIATGTIRACDEPHDAEIYARVSLNDDLDAPYPGDDQILIAADAVCLERFEPYVGLRYVDARLEIVHLRPPRAAWVRGDRVVVCAVVNAVPGPLAGTVARSES